MTKFQITILSSLLSASLILTGCPDKKQLAKKPSREPQQHKAQVSDTDYSKIKATFIQKYSLITPHQWGEGVTGVKTKLNTREKVIALTFDACGTSPTSKGYDAKLIDYLKQEQIPATLFIAGKWQRANPALVQALASEPLFDLENHGYEHKPCSVNGKSVYNIKGTANVAEVTDEIVKQGLQLKKITGQQPKFYRSGTDFYDEVAVSIAGDLGYQVISYNVLGDAGATYKKEQVKQALLSAKPGSIVIMHMNHPEGDTAEGVIEAIPILRQQGYKFVKLKDYPLEH